MARSALTNSPSQYDDIDTAFANGLDVVLQPEMSYSQRGYPPPHTGVLDEPAPPIERIPPSPWNNPRFGPQGWNSDTNEPVSDEPPGAKYKSNFLSPAERGFISDTGNPPLPPQDVVIPSGPRLPASALTPASYAGDVLAPYARGNARLGEPSSVEGVKDIFADRIKTMAADMPPDILRKFEIISGFRNAARQHEVNPRVTNSRHMYGIAVDTTSDPDVLNWINNTNGKYGVDYTLRHLPNEQNHLEMVENGVRAPLPSTQSAQPAQPAQPTQPTQPPSAAAADRTQEVAQAGTDHPVFAYENALEQFPVLHSQQLIAGPGKQLEYWPPNEPGTPDRPRPDYIPIDQSGMELGPNSTPMDILGDIVSHHMTKKDPVIKKHYESFKESLTDTQKELLQAQYMYYTKNEGETRPYAQWEKSAGLPAYFRGYAFGQWPAEFNQKAYTPAQRYHFDRMMDYLRGNQHQQPPTALQ